MTPTRAVALATLLMAGAACAPEPATRESARVTDLYGVFSIVAAVVFVVVAGLIAFSIVRFRGRPGDDADPSQFHTNVGLEITWFAIPQVIVVVLFVMSAVVLDDVEDPADAGGRGPVQVQVAAFQWGWRFEYSDGGVTIDGLPDDPAEIAVPVGRTTRFVLRSEDVIHSFWVPRWFVKRDANPGSTNEIEVTPTQAGTFRGHCAEFCGLLHDRMIFSVTAMPPAEFEDWLAQHGEES